jgi:anaerobic selenocysteine-containing dehydrogenase
MMMYHSWDSQNAWLRQIISENYLYMNRGTAARLGLGDFDWVWVESHHGRLRCQLKTMEGVEANTVWTWNAIGRQAGTAGLDEDASEATAGFLLNHLISELLPKGRADDRRLTNSDPVTGQAAWFDLRVKVSKCSVGETGIWPKFPMPKRLPGDNGRRPSTWRYHTEPAS